MAKSKKNQSKAFKQKVKKIVSGDIFKSVAAASILLNILFLVAIFVLSSANSFDRKVYVASRDKYCENSEARKVRAKELGSDTAALKERQVDCVGKDFAPFYNEALQKFNAQANQ
jgi:hypothetical protein